MDWKVCNQQEEERHLFKNEVDNPQIHVCFGNLVPSVALEGDGA